MDYVSAKNGERSRIITEFCNWLRFQKQIGVVNLERTRELGSLLAASEKERDTLPPGGAVNNAVGRSGNPETTAKTLSELRRLAEGCTRCELSKGRHSVVFGEGPEDARLVLVGEAPGREEDLKGLPFVGRSGELLTKMLRAVNISRRDVFITSVVKCRPPANRTPAQAEIASCSVYLFRQLELLDPPLVLALGQVAANTLLGKRASLRDLRGRFHPLGKARLLVTYHPAFLLRFGGEKQKAFKREAWHDLQLLEREYAGYR